MTPIPKNWMIVGYNTLSAIMNPHDRFLIYYKGYPGKWEIQQMMDKLETLDQKWKTAKS